ncbi:MAG: T9SS type A sorting domain-containing protein [Saprospiraceae bacterium]|nr:T9SS type A sorting domain-containing protein [Saprospiraceae bacterium]
MPLNGGRIAYCGGKDQRRPNSSASLTSHGVVAITDNVGNLIHFIEVNDFDTTTLEGYYGLTADKDENIYACGIVKKSGFNHDAVIVKVSPNGKLIWRKQIPSPDYLEGVFNAFVQDDNSILFIGDSYNPDFFGDKFSVVLLINMSPNGLINWTKRIMKIYDGEIRYCVEDPSNNYICSGKYFSEAGKKGDGYLVKFSAKGDSIWSRIINKSDRSTEQFFNISKASDGGFYLTGFSWIDSINTSKSWIVKVDSFGCLVPGCHKVVDTKDVSNGREKAFVLYPNPAASTVYIHARTGSGMDMELRIYDLLGTLVQRKVFIAHSGHQYQLDLDASIPNGQYLIAFYNRTGPCCNRMSWRS